MAVNKKKSKDISQALREAAKNYAFKDQGLVGIIREATNPYQMLQAINYSGRLNDIESHIVSRVFLHIDSIAKQIDRETREDKVEALIAVFKCLLTSMKARETRTGSLFIDNKKDTDWEMVEAEDDSDYVVVTEGLGAWSINTISRTIVRVR